MSLKNSTVVPIDTTVEAWQMQMNAVALMTPDQRISVWEEMQKQFAIMEESAMKRLHPDFDDYRILVELVRARFGDELASKIIASSDVLPT